jgi:hypothetical protein
MAAGRKTGGRTKGTPNKATADVKAAAQAFTADALNTLASIMRNEGAADAARVAASNALLDRGHGKPMQSVEMDATIGQKRAVEMSEEELLAIAAGSRPGGT